MNLRLRMPASNDQKAAIVTTQSRYLEDAGGVE